MTITAVFVGAGAICGSEPGAGRDGRADVAAGVRTTDLRVPADDAGGTFDIGTAG